MTRVIYKMTNIDNIERTRTNVTKYIPTPNYYKQEFINIEKLTN